MAGSKHIEQVEGAKSGEATRLSDVQMFPRRGAKKDSSVGTTVGTIVGTTGAPTALSDSKAGRRTVPLRTKISPAIRERLDRAAQAYGRGAVVRLVEAGLDAELTKLGL